MTGREAIWLAGLAADKGSPEENWIERWGPTVLMVIGGLTLLKKGVRIVGLVGIGTAAYVVARRWRRHRLLLQQPGQGG